MEELTLWIYSDLIPHTSFIFIPSLVNFKAFALIVQWPARLFCLSYLPILYLYVLFLQAYILIIALMISPSSPFLYGFLRRRSSISRQYVVARTTVLNLFSRIKNLNPFSRIENTFSTAGLVAAIFSLGIIIRRARPEILSELSIIHNFSITESELLFVACICFISISISNIALVYYFTKKIFGLRHKIVEIVAREFFLIVGIVSIIIILLSVYLWILNSYIDYLLPVGFVFFGLGCIVLFSWIAQDVLSFFRQRKQLVSAPDTKFNDRSEIEALFRRWRVGISGHASFVA